MELFSKKNKNEKNATKKEVVQGITDGIPKPEESIPGFQDLLGMDEQILDVLNHLRNKIDDMDKVNKKFLMAASNDNAKRQEEENHRLKQCIADMLDQMGMMVAAVQSGGTENLKQGTRQSWSRIVKLSEEVGLYILSANPGEPFNPTEQKCLKTACRPDMEDGVVVELLMPGFIDRSSGHVLRYAQVTVNKIVGEE